MFVFILGFSLWSVPYCVFTVRISPFICYKLSDNLKIYSTLYYKLYWPILIWSSISHKYHLSDASSMMSSVYVVHRNVCMFYKGTVKHFKTITEKQHLRSHKIHQKKSVNYNMILKTSLVSKYWLQKTIYTLQIHLFLERYFFPSSTEELSVVPGWIHRVSPVVHRLVGVRHVPSHRLRGAVSWMWGRSYNTEWDKYQTTVYIVH